jgi:hypothetical protein
MKALSVLQPWAWLLTYGPKRIENRSWPTRYRGPVLVHAGKGFDREGYEWARRHFPDLDLPKLEHYERGGIVGSMTITGCVEESDDPWFFGPYGFTTKDNRPLPFRRCLGTLGFFEPKYGDDSEKQERLL